MSSPNVNSSPKYKNLISKPKQSPIELKEKMRKNYKNKVLNCRGMLLDQFRGAKTLEQDFSNTLAEIYKRMFIFPDDIIVSEENEVLEEIKNELVQEELDWWRREYERSQMDNFDWSSMDQNNSVICPICQKANINLENNLVTCSHCHLSIKTQSTLLDIQKSILEALDKHNSMCNSNSQFTIIPDTNETHVYLICENCNEMKSVI